MDNKIIIRNVNEAYVAVICEDGVAYELRENFTFQVKFNFQGFSRLLNRIDLMWFWDCLIGGAVPRWYTLGNDLWVPVPQQRAVNVWKLRFKKPAAIPFWILLVDFVDDF